MRLSHSLNCAFAALLVASALWTGAPWANSAQAQSFFTAQLAPPQQSSDVVSSASGTGAFVLDGDGLRFFVTIDSLTSAMSNAHFHLAQAGVDGATVRTIAADFTGNSASGIWTSTDTEPLTSELIADLFAGNLYVNIHTADYPNGEIRGQIHPSSGTALSATLTSDQEVAAVTSDGSGTASIQVTDEGVLFFVTVDSLTGPPVNAHFHSARAGIDGGVVRTILGDFEGNTGFGLWTAADAEPLTDELRDALLSGELYINVHTGTYTAGEIRGQALLSSGWGFYAALDTAQVNDAVTTTGSGTGTFTLTDAGLVFHVTVDSLTGPILNIHFHHATTGEDGPVVHGIFPELVGNTATGVWTPEDDEPLTDELVRELVAGNLYVNVHTTAYSNGEIRGQVLLREGAEFTARLDAAQEDGVTEEGVGTAALSLTDAGLEFRVTGTGLTGDIINAHFHQGDIGVSGGIVRGIFDDLDGNTASGVWTSTDAEPLTADMIEALLRGQLYINIHTVAHTAGEIRGQVLPSEGAPLRAFLTNEAADEPVTQEGSGTAAMVLTDQGLVYDVTVTGLTGEILNMHFHRGEAGVAGPVVHGIFDKLVGGTASGVWDAADGEPLTGELLEALVKGELYLNVHTAAHTGGEIRGQVYLSGGIGAAVQLDPAQEGAGITSDGTGTASLTLSQAGLAYGLTATSLTGAITDAHFHQAPPGVIGGVVRGIFDDFAGNSASGLWRPSDAEPLTNELLLELLAGNIYLNLHTAANTGGEIRGQIRPDGVVGTSIDAVSDELPDVSRLGQNYPNPFSSVTTIEFALAGSRHVLLEVYNVLGQRIAKLADSELPGGEYEARFESRNLPDGLYIYRLTVDGQRFSRTMVLLR
jgi:Cu/Zn superoxide dismutase